MNDHDTIGLYAAPLAAGARQGGAWRRLYAHYSSVLLPRDETYMRDLFQTNFPHGRFIDVGAEEGAWRQALATATTVVLLYPDPIGFGFRPIERGARAAMAGNGALRVLSGRRRSFLLTPTARFHLALRRILTRFLVAELVLGSLFLLATPALLVADRLKGSR